MNVWRKEGCKRITKAIKHHEEEQEGEVPNECAAVRVG
jgi:hypothetical protein